MPHESGALPLYRFRLFADTGVVHGISTRHGGVSRPPYDTLNLSIRVPDEPEAVAENRRRFAGALGYRTEQLVDTRQVHGDDVLVVDDEFDPVLAHAADVQVTDRPGWLLSLRFADCVPIILVHPSRRAIGVVHAGWRGTEKRAAATAVSALRELFGADARGLTAGIGPSIGPCCYEVGEEVAARFADRPAGVLRPSGGKPHLDLWELNRQALVSSGVPSELIEVAEVCTRCQAETYFSHRALGYPAGRFCAAVGLP